MLERPRGGAGRAGLRQPTMWITRDAATMELEGWPRADIEQHQSTMRAVFGSLPLLTPLAGWLGVTGPIDADRAHRIVNDSSLAFFDRHLKGQGAALLDGPAEAYPEGLLAHHQRCGAPSQTKGNPPPVCHSKHPARPLPFSPLSSRDPASYT